MEQAKKDCILVEAARCFSRFGFKKSSVDEIARRAGVAKGTVYLACESKEDLFYQVLHREVRAWQAEVARLIDPRKKADELIEILSAGALTTVEDHPLVKDLLFGRTHELLPSWRERLDELRSLGLATVIEVLRLGVKQGVFRKDLDIETTASLLQDLQLAAMLFHSPNLERLVRVQRAGLDLVLDGLRIR
jgi:AcrR family transcriptional regulator